MWFERWDLKFQKELFADSKILEIAENFLKIIKIGKN